MGSGEITLRYAMVSRGRRVKGTRYSRAGWAALNTSDDTVAVSNPDTKRRTHVERQYGYQTRLSLMLNCNSEEKFYSLCSEYLIIGHAFNLSKLL